jgi:hypothetical protein
MTLSTLVNGYILGWSVAWPPGPINSIAVRRVLAIVSLVFLLVLAVHFAIGAWKIYRAHRSIEFQAPKNERRGGFLLGLFIVLESVERRLLAGRRRQ